MQSVSTFSIIKLINTDPVAKAICTVKKHTKIPAAVSNNGYQNPPWFKAEEEAPTN